MTNKLSVAIPVYEMKDRWEEMIEISFFKLRRQTFKDFEIVISDNSNDDKIKEHVSKVTDLNIHYCKNEGAKNIAGNINNAIRNASGEIIQILCQDDYLSYSDSLETIVKNFNYDKKWLLSSYMHTNNRISIYKRQTPSWNDKIYFNNTIGEPSCVALLNCEDIPLMDDNLNWFVDCEWYYRLHKKFGLPMIIPNVSFYQFLWEGQTTTEVTKELEEKEKQYILDKYQDEIA